ncbi:hypothetical protein A9Q91_00675 [Candidatus Gracilibacteria bacterium 28_42_T64]|nr:hypothetical protein A9Q91_00675 [Candidatus Gracilibacteria bacterium 28_42_T64]
MGDKKTQNSHLSVVENTQEEAQEMFPDDTFEIQEKKRAIFDRTVENFLNVMSNEGFSSQTLGEKLEEEEWNK